MEKKLQIKILKYYKNIKNILNNIKEDLSKYRYVYHVHGLK